MRLAGYLILAISVLAVACDDDNKDTSTSPTAAVGEEASITADAEAACPDADADFFEACVSAYVSQADSSRAAVLCVSERDGTWYFATPGATPDLALGEEGSQGTSVGDECREEGHVVVAVVGG